MQRVFELLFGKASATRTAGFGGLPCESHKIRFPCPPAGLRAEPRLSGSNRNCRCSATTSTQPLAELPGLSTNTPVQRDSSVPSWRGPITFRQLPLKAAHRNFHRLQGSLKWANIHSGVAPTEIRTGTFHLSCQAAITKTLALYTEVRKAGLGSRCSLRGRSR